MIARINATFPGPISPPRKSEIIGPAESRYGLCICQANHKWEGWHPLTPEDAPPNYGDDDDRKFVGAWRSILPALAECRRLNAAELKDGFIERWAMVVDSPDSSKLMQPFSRVVTPLRYFTRDRFIPRSWKSNGDPLSIPPGPWVDEQSIGGINSDLQHDSAELALASMLEHNSARRKKKRSDLGRHWRTVVAIEKEPLASMLVSDAINGRVGSQTTFVTHRLHVVDGANWPISGQITLGKGVRQ